MRAHDNSLQVGDWVSFQLDGIEQVGSLVEVLDCVHGKVETEWGTFTTELYRAKLFHRDQVPEQTANSRNNVNT
jgi:hypothetical protein